MKKAITMFQLQNLVSRQPRKKKLETAQREQPVDVTATTSSHRSKVGSSRGKNRKDITSSDSDSDSDSSMDVLRFRQREATVNVATQTVDDVEDVEEDEDNDIIEGESKFQTDEIDKVRKVVLVDVIRPEDFTDEEDEEAGKKKEPKPSISGFSKLNKHAAGGKAMSKSKPN